MKIVKEVIKSNKYKFLSIIMLFIVFKDVKNELVCTEDELVRELNEDIEDNGKLDCLRESLPIPGETPKEQSLRLKANWDSDCSFESISDGINWISRLEKNYSLSKGLIDVNGKPYKFNKPEQADMCEIIRSLIGNSLFPNIGNDVTNLNKDLTKLIDCPGDEGATEVCAATPYSFAEKKGWYIFIDGKGITVSGQPTYTKASLSINDETQ